MVLQLWIVSDHRRENNHRKLQEAQITACENKEADHCRRMKITLTRKC